MSFDAHVVTMEYIDWQFEWISMWMGMYDEFTNKIIKKKLDLVVVEFFEKCELECVHFGILVEFQIRL